MNLENTRNDILVEFWESKEVNAAIGKMHPVELQEDLKSELFLILAEMPEDKLKDLYKKQQLKFYIVRIMLNLVQSTDKKFYKKFRDFVEYIPQEKIEPEETDLTKDVTEYFEQLYWYNKEILRLYTFEFDKNAKELSRKTGIPYMSIIRTLNQTKNQLKKAIRK